MKRKTGGKLSTNCEFLVVEGLDSGNETNTIKIKKHNLRKKKTLGKFITGFLQWWKDIEWWNEQICAFTDWYRFAGGGHKEKEKRTD